MISCSEIKHSIENISLKTDDVANLKDVCRALINVAEESANTIQSLTDQLQILRDEINVLKGEQAKPKFGNKKSTNEDHSSEEERSESEDAKKEKKSKAKNHKIIVNRTEVCPVDKLKLPADAQFKGYQNVIVQDIIITTDNIEFRKEVYYSPSLNKSIMGELPIGYQGEFGPGIKALVLSLNNSWNMTLSAIGDFLSTHNVHISASSIARIILDGAEFSVEKHAIISAGLKSTNYQHIDDTGAKVNGENHYTHVLCNPYYTAYFTRPDKSRLTVLEILNNGELEHKFNDTAYSLMQRMGLSKVVLDKLKSNITESILTKHEMKVLLDTLFTEDSHHKSKRIIFEASSIAGYRDQEQAIQILLCDDAPQFKQITQELALCWVHEARHYKKLTPTFSEYKQELAEFLEEFWIYYKELLEYKKLPTKDKSDALSAKFDIIFNKPYKYRVLTGFMESTRGKKSELLAVLKYPEIPLHNNPAELGARAQARKRDISLHTKTINGTQAKDTMMTIVQTARKLGVNVFKYIHDRISKKFEMESLADLILAKVNTT